MGEEKRLLEGKPRRRITTTPGEESKEEARRSLDIEPSDIYVVYKTYNVIL